MAARVIFVDPADEEDSCQGINKHQASCSLHIFSTRNWVVETLMEIVNVEPEDHQ